MADRLQQSLVTHILATDARFGPLAVLSERLSQLDLSVLLVYLVDLVGADLLPVLAEQFHVMGDEGWLLANADDQRRTLIKRAIELHRYKGTTWAVKEVLAVLAIEVELLEWWQQQPAAAPYTFGLTAWANQNLLPGKPMLNAELYERLQRMVDMVKPVRSSFKFKVGARFDQAIWELASAQQVAAVGRWSCSTQPVRPCPPAQPIQVTLAQQATSITRVSTDSLPVQPLASPTIFRLASTVRFLSIIRVTMEVQ